MEYSFAAPLGYKPQELAEFSFFKNMSARPQQRCPLTPPL
jgi:hypothetical protein